VVVIAGPVLGHGELGVRTPSPVQFEADRRRIIGSIGDHFVQDSAQDALLQRGGRMRMIPELFPGRRREPAIVGVALL
jgi:hypothetical protein